MDSPRLKRARLGAAMLAGALALAGAAEVAAQVASNGVYRETAADALARHLRALAAEPRSLGALMGAGKAALEVGDPHAAITFYARAEEIAPRDGRIKAGFGSAFLAMEQPGSALKFFEEAVSLGVADADVAGERGLAHDLLGDPRRAQADYRAALRRADNPEVRRRLALSLAITGDRTGALAAIDDQLRQKDRAAWRTRAFVLALTGDAAGATEAVQAAMPAQAAAMRPFLERLPMLNAAQRAMAVHYGTMPSAGAIQMARNDAVPPYTPPAPGFSAPPSATDAGRPDRGQSALGRRNPPPEPVSTEPRRRPGAQESASAAPRRAGEQPARAREQRETPRRVVQRSQRQSGIPLMAQTRAAPAPARPRDQTERRPTELASASPARTPPEAAPAEETPAASAPAPRNLVPQAIAPSPTEAQPQPVVRSPIITAPAPAEAEPAPAGMAGAMPQSLMPPALAQEAPSAANPSASQFDLRNSIASAGSSPPPSPAVTAPPPADRAADPAAAPGFAAIAELVASLPDQGPEQQEPPVRTARADPPAAAAPKPPAAKPQAKPAAKPDSKPEAAKPRQPSRIWVQIAGSADKKALPREFARLRAKAPKLLAGKTAWTTPLRFTNRLLVGPFKTDKEAQAFVNELNKLDFEAFSWTSPAGQEIEKLAAT